MQEIVEHNQVDLRYQNFRVQNPTIEKRLLVSIEDNGIQVPLEVFKEEGNSTAVLLDGFKRYRCASRLGIHQLPVTVIGTSEVEGLFRIIRHNDKSSLSGFEQACFIEQLHTVYHLGLSEIARRVDRSVAWVRVRIDMLTSISEPVRAKIISGAFPLRSYMYDLASVTRVRGNKERVEQFVAAVSGRNYSTRDISVLSRAFFSGNEMVAQQIVQGNTDWTLRMLKNKADQNNPMESPREKLLQQVRTCQWHINTTIKSIENNAKLLTQPSIQDAMNQLRNKCSYLLSINQ